MFAEPRKWKKENGCRWMDVDGLGRKLAGWPCCFMGLPASKNKAGNEQGIVNSSG